MIDAPIERVLTSSGLPFGHAKARTRNLNPNILVRSRCALYPDGSFPHVDNTDQALLAGTIAILAVESGGRGYFTNAEDMVNNIAQTIRQGNLASKLKTDTAPSILAIDDVGLLPMEPSATSAVYQIVNRRYEKQHPTIVTTNRSMPDWGEIFGDTVVASAILDRLMHNAVVFNIKGPSWRLREHHALTTESRSNYHHKPTSTPHPTPRLSLIANSAVVHSV